MTEAFESTTTSRFRSKCINGQEAERSGDFSHRPSPPRSARFFTEARSTALNDAKLAAKALRGQVFDNLLVCARKWAGQLDRAALLFPQHLLENPASPEDEEPTPPPPPAPTP